MVLDSLLCAELSRGCSSAASSDSNSQIPPKPEPRAAPRSSLLLSLLRGVCGTRSCSQLCPTVLAWGRFLSLIPVVVVTSSPEPGGILIPLIRAGSLDFLGFHLGFWLLFTAHWSCPPDVLAFTPLLYLLSYQVHFAPCIVPGCLWCWFQTSAGSYRTPELTAELISQNYSVQKYLVLDLLLLRFGSSS